MPIKAFSLAVITLLLVGCGHAPTTDTMPPAPEPGTETEIEQNDDDMLTPPIDEMKALEVGQGLTLLNFTERQLITSPLEINGTAPRSWFFEGIFPVTLLTLEEELVLESYASGPWLEPVGESEELNADDLVPFTAVLEFTTPEAADMGKIRFAADATGADETGEAVPMVETLVIFGE